MIVAILMIALILLMCIMVEDYIGIIRSSMIAQTYQIFILSWPCQLVVEIFLERILHLQWYIILPSVFVAGIIGPLLIIIFFDKIEDLCDTRILSIIVGK